MHTWSDRPHICLLAIQRHRISEELDRIYPICPPEFDVILRFRWIKQAENVNVFVYDRNGNHYGSSLVLRQYFNLQSEILQSRNHYCSSIHSKAVGE